MKERDIRLKSLRQVIAQHLRPFSMDVYHTPLKKQKDRRMAGQFVDRIHSSSFDLGNLPYYSKDGTAKGANKAECVLAMMSLIVQLYWKIASEDREGLTKILDGELKKLDMVYYEFDRLPLFGDEKGYCLLKSYRKDLDENGKKQKKQIPEKDGTKEVDEGTDRRSEDKSEKQDEQVKEEILGEYPGTP